MKLTIDLTNYQGETLAMALQNAKMHLLLGMQLAKDSGDQHGLKVFTDRAAAIDTIALKLLGAAEAADHAAKVGNFINRAGLN
jgi:hypothetical protein